jgi:hypothetical protein
MSTAARLLYITRWVSLDHAFWGHYSLAMMCIGVGNDLARVAEML